MYTSINNVQKNLDESNENRNNLPEKPDLIQESSKDLELVEIYGIHYIDSRIVAAELGVTHDHLITIIDQCKHIIEKTTGKITKNEALAVEPNQCNWKYLFTEDQLTAFYSFLPENFVTAQFKMKMYESFRNALDNVKLPMEEQYVSDELQLIDSNGIKLIDSRLVAKGLGIEHESLIKTLNAQKKVIEEEFGPLRFEIGVAKNAILGSNPPKYVFLNEGQATFISSLSKNTIPVIKFKAKLVKAFLLARQAIKELTSITQEQLAFERDEIISSIIKQLPSVMAPLIEQQCDKAIDAFLNPVGTVKGELDNQSASKKEEKLLTEVQAANRLHMPIEMFLRLQTLGLGPTKTMVGSDIMYSRNDIDAYETTGNDDNNPARKAKNRIQLARQICLCANIKKGKGSSGTRMDVGDVRRIRLLQEFIKLTDGKKVSQSELVKQALDLFCEKKVYSIN